MQQDICTCRYVHALVEGTTKFIVIRNLSSANQLERGPFLFGAVQITNLRSLVWYSSALPYFLRPRRLGVFLIGKHFFHFFQNYQKFRNLYQDNGKFCHNLRKFSEAEKSGKWTVTYLGKKTGTSGR